MKGIYKNGEKACHCRKADAGKGNSGRDSRHGKPAHLLYGKKEMRDVELPSYGYSQRVYAGWMSLFINASEGVDVDIFLTKIPKENIYNKIGMQVKLKRASASESHDTDSDYHQRLDTISSGEYMMLGLSGGEDFYYLSTLLTVVADSLDELEYKYRELEKRVKGQGMIPVIPDKLMIEYLMRRFDMTPNRARETIYNACRQYAKKKPVCYATNGGLARYNDLAMNSKIMQQCRAFRVACEFLPESRAFSLPKLHPWLLNFCEDGHAYYVCEFKRGEELLLSDMIRSTGIQQEMRPVTRRVAILAPGANRSLISECGIKFFCTVDDEWDLAVTESVPDDEVWNGVPVV